MEIPNIIDLRNAHRGIKTETDEGIARYNPIPEGADVDIRLLNLGPGTSTHRHNHTEVEFWTVLSGGVKIFFDNHDFLLLAGESIRVNPTHYHRIEALESGAVMQTVWWHEGSVFDEQLEKRMTPRAEARDLMLVPSMLTPNGSMHLGHASGPFVYADVIARIARLGGRQTFVVQGTHGHLEHIAIAAERDGVDYFTEAERNSASFLEALTALGSEPELFIPTRPDDRSVEIVHEVFERLREMGIIVEETHEVPYDTESGRYVVDAHVHGDCPVCGGSSSGTECEDCGALVLDAELGNPVDVNDRPLSKKKLTRLFLDLAPLEPVIERYRCDGLLPRHAKLYIDGWLSRGLPKLCISNPDINGLPVPMAGFEDQRFNVIMEYVPRHLIALEDWAHDRGKTWKWYDVPKNDLPELNILFGADNSFGRLLIIPSVLRALGLERFAPTRFYVNKMLLLDGEMFSTSRRHAIWVNDYLTQDNREALRFYFCKHRPETTDKTFSQRTFEAWMANDWNGMLQRSIDGAIHVIEHSKPGQDIAGPGQWTADETGFLKDVGSYRDLVARQFRQPYPSTPELCRAIEGMAAKMGDFAQAVTDQELWTLKEDAVFRSCVRTLVFALVVHATALTPIAPELAGRIFDRLGIAPGDRMLDLLDRDWMVEPVRLAAKN
ncbi:MAG: class I tRNA ligase family protein [Rhodobacter sp.]|nr:class I tRNA ligase family protein [Rhodobacter sp.]